MSGTRKHFVGLASSGLDKVLDVLTKEQPFIGQYEAILMNHTYRQGAWFGALIGALVALAVRVNVAFEQGITGNAHFIYALAGIALLYLTVKGAEQKNKAAFVFSLMFLYFLNSFEAVAYQYGYFGPSKQFGYAMHELNFYVKLPLLGPLVCLSVSFSISLSKKIATTIDGLSF
jgi:hypothetical protein